MSLVVASLTVRYPGAERPAVDAVDLTVATGEIVALLGPSGSGKSSLLRAVAGLEVPTAGSVVVAGRTVDGVAPERRGVGFMFQDYALFPHLDVAGNIGFGPRMAGWARARIAARVDAVLDLVGLAGYGGRSIASLSGGEQQRVALARALAPEPTLVLLDEPLGALDRSLREQLGPELRALFRSLGTTVLTVTHDQTEAFTVADRVAVLRDGRLVQAERPSRLWRRPADGFVARFLGFANVVPVEVAGGAVATAWGPLPAPQRGDGPAALVLRPGALSLVAATGPGGAPTRPGVVVAVGFRGDHFVVDVEVDGHRYQVVDREAEAPEVGHAVTVGFDASAAVVVDP